MTQLFINLLERLGIFAIAFILIMRFDIFKRLLTSKAAAISDISAGLRSAG